jgi:prepilin-type N-terminal cleavage/methylation domain-containing protein
MLKYDRILFKKIFNKKGFSLAEITIGIALLSVVLLISVQMLSMVTRLDRSTSSKINLVDIKNTLNFYLSQEKAVVNMINNNASMSCIKDNTSCAGLGGSVDVFNGDPVTPAAVAGFQTSVGTEGFTAAGVPCTTYPSANCAFKYNISWQPRCGVDATRCLGHAINYVFTANLVRDAAYTGPTIELSTFNLMVARNSAGEMAQEICTSFNGVYNNTDKSCSMAINNPCPPGRFFIGLNADNSKLCMSVSAGIKCPLGSVVYRIDAGGNLYCRSGCYIQPGFECITNMWTGAGTCPAAGLIAWDTGNGIIATGPTPGFSLQPYAEAPPPPHRHRHRHRRHRRHRHRRHRRHRHRRQP